MRTSRLVVAATAVLLLAAACGAEAGGGPGGGGGELSLDITMPSDGAQLQVPFTVQLSSSVALGPTDTGKHHVHIYYDGDEQEYDVVESDSFEVTELSPGKHTIVASLRNADHSDTGVESEVEVMVASNGKAGGGGEDNGGGYNY